MIFLKPMGIDMNTRVVNYQITWAEPGTNLNTRDPDVRINGIHAETKDDAIFKLLSMYRDATIIKIEP